MKRIYIAGPMTGLPDYNLQAFADAARALLAAGHVPINPGSRGVRTGWEWPDYMRAALHQLIDCDAVALLPGWENSRGAQIEQQLAQNLRMPTFPLDVWLRQEIAW